MLLGLSESRVKRAMGEQRRTRQVCAGPHDKKGARLLYRHEDPLVLYRYSARYKEHARRSGFAANCLHARVEFRSLKNWYGVREPTIEKAHHRRNSIIPIMETVLIGKPRFLLRVQLQHDYGVYFQVTTDAAVVKFCMRYIFCERRSKMERRNERMK